MKVIVNGVEIDIIGGSRLVYDVEADSLSVDPINSPNRHQNIKKPKENNQSENISSEKTDKKIYGKGKFKLTQDELRQRILEVVSLTKDWTAAQYVTIHCLGIGSKASEIKYLKLLLAKMVDENVLISSNETGRTRYKLA